MMRKQIVLISHISGCTDHQIRKGQTDLSTDNQPLSASAARSALAAVKIVFIIFDWIMTNNVTILVS